MIVGYAMIHAAGGDTRDCGSGADMPIQRQVHYSGVRDRSINEEATWPSQPLSTPPSKRTQDKLVSLPLV